MSLDPRHAEEYRRQNVTHLRRVAKAPQRKSRVQRLRETCGLVPYRALPIFPAQLRKAAEDANSRIFVRRFLSGCAITAAAVAMSSLFSGCGGRGEVECSIESRPAYDGNAWPYLCLKGKWVFAGPPPAVEEK